MEVKVSRSGNKIMQGMGFIWKCEAALRNGGYYGNTALERNIRAIYIGDR